jgi:hypothetical protein
LRLRFRFDLIQAPDEGGSSRAIMRAGVVQNRHGEPIHHPFNPTRAPTGQDAVGGGSGEIGQRAAPQRLAGEGRAVPEAADAAALDGHHQVGGEVVLADVGAEPNLGGRIRRSADRQSDTGLVDATRVEAARVEERGASVVVVQADFGGAGGCGAHRNEPDGEFRQEHHANEVGDNSTGPQRRRGSRDERNAHPAPLSSDAS